MSYAQRIIEIISIFIVVGCLALGTRMYSRDAVYSFSVALITTCGVYLWARSAILEPKLSQADIRPSIRTAMFVMSFAVIGASLGMAAYFAMRLLLPALETL
jgi:uncharacterized membrane protein YfbV (UPF0208 family)